MSRKSVSISPKKTDRRVLRTRDALGDALVALMHEKPFDEITVQHVLDRVKFGGTTFYTHFVGKEDLFLSDVEDFFQMMSCHLSHKKEPSTHSLRYAKCLLMSLRRMNLWPRSSPPAEFTRFSNSPKAILRRELNSASPKFPSPAQFRPPRAQYWASQPPAPCSPNVLVDRPRLSRVQPTNGRRVS